MIDANTGKNLGKCFKVVSQVYEEIDTLIAALKNHLTENFADQWVEGDWEEIPKKRVGLFYTDYICSALLDDGSSLGFQISLTGTGVSLDGNEEPLLHVFKWYLDKEVKPNLEDYSMGYPVSLGAELWGDSLIVWPFEEYLGWTFSLRLVALTNKESLEEHIIESIKKLLAKPALMQADYENDPISTWEGLVRYNTKNGQLISIKAANES
jgi:hypothetical protein